MSDNTTYVPKIRITRELLSNYIFLESNIKSMKRRLNHFKEHPLTSEHGVVQSSMKDYPYAQCHYVVSAPNIKSDTERKQMIKQLMIDLKGNIEVCENMKADIELFINNISDVKIQTVMRLKYIERYTDEKIGEKLGYQRSSIGKMIDTFLAKYNKDF